MKLPIKKYINPILRKYQLVLASIKTKIKHSVKVKMVLSNTIWLLADKFLRLGVGLFVGAWLARYLGPEQYGSFNYAAAIVGIFASVATLGLNNIVVRDLVKIPDDSNTTLGTAYPLMLVGAIFATTAAVSLISVMRPEDPTLKMMVAIFSISTIFKASDVIKCWFETKLQSKYIVLIENSSFLLISAIKVWLILVKAPLLAFAWIILAEAIFVNALMFYMYSMRASRLSAWRYKSSRARQMLKDSWPLIFAGIAGMLQMRIDQIMLGEMLGNYEVGIYSAAARISEIAYLIPVTVIASAYPLILKERDKDLLNYAKYQRLLFLLMFHMSVIISAPITLGSDFVVESIYGERYEQSAKILAIHIIGSFFVFSGLASNRWFVAENLQIYTLYRIIAGTFVNIIMNYLLIPTHGVIGAAYATLASQAVASVFFNALNSKTKKLFLMQIEALTGVSTIKMIINKRI